jgi:hypothetical protein
MQEALRSASIEDLYDLVDALLVAANYGNNWDAHGALPARQLAERLGLQWEFTDWQDAFNLIVREAAVVVKDRDGPRLSC